MLVSEIGLHVALEVPQQRCPQIPLVGIVDVFSVLRRQRRSERIGRIRELWGFEPSDSKAPAVDESGPLPVPRREPQGRGLSQRLVDHSVGDVIEAAGILGGAESSGHIGIETCRIRLVEDESDCAADRTGAVQGSLRAAQNQLIVDAGAARAEIGIGDSGQGPGEIRETGHIRRLQLLSAHRADVVGNVLDALGPARCGDENLLERSGVGSNAGRTEQATEERQLKSRGPGQSARCTGVHRTRRMPVSQHGFIPRMMVEDSSRSKVNSRSSALL